MTLYFIFRLVHYGREDVSFNIICLNVLEDIKQFYLLMWLKKPQLETPFKGDVVKASIKTSKCENLVLFFSEKVQKIAICYTFSVFSDQTIASKWFWLPPMIRNTHVTR